MTSSDARDKEGGCGSVRYNFDDRCNVMLFSRDPFRQAKDIRLAPVLQRLPGRRILWVVFVDCS
jgi:hypothetical protein